MNVMQKKQIEIQELRSKISKWMEQTAYCRLQEKLTIF